VEQEKKIKMKKDVVRSIGKQFRGSHSRRRKRMLWREGFVEKEGFKHGGKSEGVMDDNSGESTVEEVLAAIFYGFR